MKGTLIKDTPHFKMDTLRQTQKDDLKRPYIGVTQGGSSRKHSGARVAATDASVKSSRKEK